jgi:hypothetical protein
MTPKICHGQRESQIEPHGIPESEWPQHALELFGSCFDLCVEAVCDLS